VPPYHCEYVAFCFVEYGACLSETVFVFYSKNGEVFYSENGEVFYSENGEVFYSENGVVSCSKNGMVFYSENDCMMGNCCKCGDGAVEISWISCASVLSS